MQRYSSFRKLKEVTRSGLNNNLISRNTENQVKDFIDLLKASALETVYQERKVTEQDGR